jgi:hypothetical protein
MPHGLKESQREPYGYTLGRTGEWSCESWLHVDEWDMAPGDRLERAARGTEPSSSGY